MKRYEPCGEDMCEAKDGEYVRFDDLPGWVSTKDRLPEEDFQRRILICWRRVPDQPCEVHVAIFHQPYAHEPQRFESIDDGGWDTAHIEEVSHWMPLPEAPK
ncbi:MAG: DUF551 domain-containing protein [Candidatus Hydrogenedentes bacterium]|nr:DUF551 domain-containing protein [Candidatus Hydrogenedentota bacterium]